MLLLAGSSKEIDIEELKLSIAESMEYISICGVSCHSEFAGNIKLDSELVIFIYELFEEALEKAMPDLNAVFVTMSVRNQELKFYMEIGLPRQLLEDNWNCETVTKLNGQLAVDYSDDSEFVTFTAKMGGAK